MVSEYKLVIKYEERLSDFEPDSCSKRTGCWSVHSDQRRRTDNAK